MPVVEGLAYLQTFVKASAIYNQCGKTAVWFSQRYKQNNAMCGTYRFTEKDVDLLNKAIHELSARFGHLYVTADSSRDVFLQEFSDILSYIKNGYIRDTVLQVDLRYWNNRTTKQKRTDGCYRFSSEEIEKINSAVKHIAEILTSTTLTI